MSSGRELTLACREGRHGSEDRSGDSKAELVSSYSSVSAVLLWLYRSCQRCSDSHRFERRVNTSPSTIEDKEVLQKLLCTPPIKKIDLHFPLGLEVTARNMKGVTIKDAVDAIYKQYKKKVSPL